MNWEQRLREMVLAGGALAATACFDFAAAAPNRDAESDAVSDLDGDASFEAGSSSSCCNANGDPCCPLGYCGDAEPSAPAYILCEQEQEAGLGDSANDGEGQGAGDAQHETGNSAEHD
jgi:hypothetical protein